MSTYLGRKVYTVEAHKAQLEFIACRDVPYIGYVGGRGSGKSTAAAMRLYKWSMLDPGLYGMYAPSFPLLADTILRVFLEVAKPHIAKHDLGRNIIRMQSGSEIICRSLDDYERARGPSLRGAVWDEASLCPEEAFNVLIPGLRYEGKQGWLACAFTPKGLQHWTAKVFNVSGDPDIRCFHSTTYDNPFNPENFEATIRRRVTKAYAEQEIEGHFVNLHGALLKREWFRIVKDAPSLTSVARYWDMAATLATGSNDPDWTSGAKMGRTADGRFILLDMRHDRLSPAGNEMLIEQTAKLDGRQVKIFMEEEGGASGKSLVAHYARNVLSGYAFKGDRPTGDKVTRAMPFAAAAEAGNVLLLAGDWNKAFLDEVEMFGPDADHDDQIDSCSGAFGQIAIGRHPNIRPHIGMQTEMDEINLLNKEIRELEKVES